MKEGKTKWVFYLSALPCVVDIEADDRCVYVSLCNEYTDLVCNYVSNQNSAVPVYKLNAFYVRYYVHCLQSTSETTVDWACPSG